jgi:pantoate--beta-alanine ligase
MQIAETNQTLHQLLLSKRQMGKSIGFVPTMGALHAGHVSLINKSKSETDFTICSIFVNPTQFNDPQDFEKYPRTVEKDITILANSGCDALFLPSVGEIYPNSPNQTQNAYDFGYLSQPMEGAFRPGHFDGMAQVVKRLLDLVQPDQLFMGQKDYQQLMIVRQLLALSHCPTQLVMVETLRDPDGLAMSSRNTRLNHTERQQAVQLYKTLLWAKTVFHNMPINELKQQALNQLAHIESIKPEYFEIVNADTLYPIERHNEHPKIVALVAAKLGNIRLIDNLFIKH